LVFVKRIRDLSHRGQRVKTPEAIVRYLAKYLIKNFRLRKDPEKAKKHGLLPGYRYQAECELARYFELNKEKKLRVKSKARQQAQEPPLKNSYSPIDFIK
ncbi:8282_t:CDS:2, partial [Racocetra persica]